MKPLESPWQRKWIALDVTHPKIQQLGAAAEAFCHRWYRNRPQPALLVVCGDTGTAKTHTTKAIAKFARAAAGRSFAEGHWGVARIPAMFYLSWPEAVAQFGDKNFSCLPDAIESDLLLLDDVGAENDPWKTGAEKLCHILSRRERRFTVLTTNVHPAQWSEVFDVRIADRLLRNSQVVDLIGVPSYVLHA